MNAPSKIAMAEATRLTREGRLKEAMAVISRALSSGSSPETAGPQPEPRPAAIDMEPPTAATGGAWTAPPAGETAPAPNRFGALDQEAMATAGRELMGRMQAGLGELGQTLNARRGRKATPAPVPIPAGARFEARSFTDQAGSRPYKLYVPSTYAGGAVSLVVMLHGCTQSPDDFAAGTRMNQLAEEGVFLVLYPGQTKAANMSKCWNWFNAGDQQRDRGEPSLIAGMTRQVMSEFPVDPARVFVAGLSAGGAKAAIMGATYPDLFRAVGVHSGLACGAANDMPSAFAAMKQGGSAATGNTRRHAQAVPTIVFHGDHDKTVHPVNGDEVVAQAKSAADLKIAVARGESPGGVRYTQTVQADGAGRPILEHWVLHGAGHAWSGGSPEGSYTDPKGPDASREMLRFFLAQAPGDHGPE